MCHLLNLPMVLLGKPYVFVPFTDEEAIQSCGTNDVRTSVDSAQKLFLPTLVLPVYTVPMK